MTEEKYLGLTPKQREWILRRDKNECQFVILDGEPHKCRSEEKLQVHHIFPRHWAYQKLGWLDKQVNCPENAITLCKVCHLEKIHFDYGIMARKLYKYSDTTYTTIHEWHQALLLQGVPYWWQFWDEQLRMVARLRTWEYLQKNPEDLFPYRKEKKALK